jgi:hypothetical protein
MSDDLTNTFQAPMPRWSTETFDYEGHEHPADQPPTVPGVTNRDDAGSNIVQRIDVTTIANDMPNDADYDDPYPGGDTASLGNPLDG